MLVNFITQFLAIGPVFKILLANRMKKRESIRNATVVLNISQTYRSTEICFFKYLCYLFRQITIDNHQITDKFMEALMPWNEQAQEAYERGVIRRLHYDLRNRSYFFAFCLNIYFVATTVANSYSYAIMQKCNIIHTITREAI